MESLERMQNMIEHTLNMYADDFVLMPAFGLYEDKILQDFEAIIQNCHIYFVGEVPAVEIISIQEIERKVCIEVVLYRGEKRGVVELPIPDNWGFVKENDHFFLLDSEGKKRVPDSDLVMFEISRQVEPLKFQVLYIGQAYGKNGERNAIDRLKEHGTLQKISVQGITPGYVLQLILVGVCENRLITHFNPFAQNTEKSESSKRISMGLDKLFGTTEAERVALYEAAMIRYFQPQYNKQLKHSFPSTNIKTLSDCYDKDMQAIVAEFCFDNFPYCLTTENVEPKDYHIANFDLHTEKARKSFFSISSE